MELKGHFINAVFHVSFIDDPVLGDVAKEGNFALDLFA